VALRTVGHGTLDADAFAALLASAEVAHVVDIRSFPGSRHNPQFGREEMERWLPDAGLDYAWIRALGGRRRPLPDSRHQALRNEGFRGYADHMETADFRRGVEQLLERDDLDATAVMCSESLWWRCHRRLLADALVVRGHEVRHIVGRGEAAPHELTSFAELEDGRLSYPPAQLTL
jgi:uncharacterized protein (DUF488 family)